MIFDIAGVVIAITALVLSMLSLKIQRQHNILTVRPIPEVTVGNFENRIVVVLENKGVGPLLIVKSFVTDTNGQNKDSVIEFMPLIQDRWRMFIHELNGRTISSGDRKVLIEYAGNDEDRFFAANRDQIRSSLSKLTIFVVYTDVYKSKMPIYSRKLDYFFKNEEQ